MNEDLALRRGTVEDIPVIALLEQACFSDPWSERAFEDFFSNPLSFCLVTEEKGAINGYACGYFLLDMCEIANIAVEPSCRRRGLASLILDTIIRESCRRQISKIMLEVRESNLPARNLYNRFGFLQVGLRKNYYTNPKENAVLMDKVLAANTDAT